MLMWLAKFSEPTYQSHCGLEEWRALCLYHWRVTTTGQHSMWASVLESSLILERKETELRMSWKKQVEGRQPFKCLLTSVDRQWVRWADEKERPRIKGKNRNSDIVYAVDCAKNKTREPQAARTQKDPALASALVSPSQTDDYCLTSLKVVYKRWFYNFPQQLRLISYHCYIQRNSFSDWT